MLRSQIRGFAVLRYHGTHLNRGRRRDGLRRGGRWCGGRQRYSGRGNGDWYLLSDARRRTHVRERKLSFLSGTRSVQASPTRRCKHRWRLPATSTVAGKSAAGEGTAARGTTPTFASSAAPTEAAAATPGTAPAAREGRTASQGRWRLLRPRSS